MKSYSKRPTSSSTNQVTSTVTSKYWNFKCVDKRRRRPQSALIIKDEDKSTKMSRVIPTSARNEIRDDSTKVNNYCEAEPSSK